MSGLIHNPETIQDLFREDLLEDSSFYQFILQKGRQEGLKQGRQEVVLMMLRQKIGAIAAETEEKIYNLSFTQLQALMEAMPNFQQPQDLTGWLASIAQWPLMKP